MPLIRNACIVEDTFATIADDAPLPANGTIVSLARFQREREALCARNAPLGVRLKSDQSPEALKGDLDRLSVVALELPTFRDGRAFSWARLLRTRLGFAGEVRAVGHILYDQIAFLLRVGVDAIELPDSISPAQFDRARREMTNVYQPATDRRLTVRELRAAQAVG